MLFSCDALASLWVHIILHMTCAYCTLQPWYYWPNHVLLDQPNVWVSVKPVFTGADPESLPLSTSLPILSLFLDRVRVLPPESIHTP